MDYQAILDKYVTKSVEAEDPSNIDQCMDWAFKYCDEIGVDRASIRHFYAFQAFTMPNDLTLKYFDYIPNTANGHPILGDIVVFGTGVGVAGHIAVVQSADVNNIRSLDQNWNGHNYCEYITHPYDNVLGWLHPENSEIIAQPIAQTFTDQTKVSAALLTTPDYPITDDMEVQAIRGTLHDLKRDNIGLLAQAGDLSRQLTECQTKPQEVPISVPEVKVYSTPLGRLFNQWANSFG